MTEIRLQNITKIYRSGGTEVFAVDDVSLAIASGEFFFLLGPSGCGKTTLLRIIAGLIEPTSGRLFFGNQDITTAGPAERNTAMVFQNYALWPHMTVERNVEYGPKMRGKRAKARRQIACENLARVEMADFLRRKPNQLSGGQQQRVALARALAAAPRCLLLDEPLSNLDARLRLHMRGQLRQIVKSSGTTAIYVTHDQKEALSMADRLAVMNAGRIVQTGSPEEIYNRPANRFVADFVGEANFIDGVVKTADGETVVIETPAGSLLAQTNRRPPIGSRVTCCIRPERIQIVPAGQSPATKNVAPSPKLWSVGDSSISAVIEGSTYLGEIHQYLCRTADGQLWRVSALTDPRSALRIGSKVELLISAADVAILE